MPTASSRGGLRGCAAELGFGCDSVGLLPPGSPNLNSCVRACATSPVHGTRCLHCWKRACACTRSRGPASAALPRGTAVAPPALCRPALPVVRRKSRRIAGSGSREDGGTSFCATPFSRMVLARTSSASRNASASTATCKSRIVGSGLLTVCWRQRSACSPHVLQGAGGSATEMRCAVRLLTRRGSVDVISVDASHIPPIPSHIPLL